MSGTHVFYIMNIAYHSFVNKRSEKMDKHKVLEAIKRMIEEKRAEILRAKYIVAKLEHDKEVLTKLIEEDGI